MKKVGTITFHWGTNYGAVLQAYALQKYIEKNNIKTELIDYYPLELKTRVFVGSCLRFKFRNLWFDYKKERKFKEFRKNELILSKKRYFSNKQLYQTNGLYTDVICGSDQVWNESFVKGVEFGKHPTPSYYLNFVDEKTNRISYAVSFGTDKLSDYTKSVVRGEILKFKKIAVRENTGAMIVQNLGKDTTITLDPTLLLDASDYNNLIKEKKYKNSSVFSYILHNNQAEAIRISDYCKKRYKEAITADYYKPDFGVYEWIYNIKNSDFVVTNSFHGVVFSIIFNTNFIVTLVEGSKMNDRIFTLLTPLGLENRIINNCDESLIDAKINSKINWDEVNAKKQELRKDSYEYLNLILNEDS